MSVPCFVSKLLTLVNGQCPSRLEYYVWFQGILGEIRSLDTQYVLLEGMLSQLVSDGANMSESWEKRKKLAERHENLQERLTDLVTHMRTAAEAIDHFHVSFVYNTVNTYLSFQAA